MLFHHTGATSGGVRNQPLTKELVQGQAMKVGSKLQIGVKRQQNDLQGHRVDITPTTLFS